TPGRSVQNDSADRPAGKAGRRSGRRFGEERPTVRGRHGGRHRLRSRRRRTRRAIARADCIGDVGVIVVASVAARGPGEEESQSCARTHGWLLADAMDNAARAWELPMAMRQPAHALLLLIAVLLVAPLAAATEAR